MSIRSIYVKQRKLGFSHEQALSNMGLSAAPKKTADNTIDMAKPNPSKTTQSLTANPKQFYSSYSSQEFADKSAQGSEFFNQTKQRGTIFGN